MNFTFSFSFHSCPLHAGPSICHWCLASINMEQFFADLTALLPQYPDPSFLLDALDTPPLVNLIWIHTITSCTLAVQSSCLSPFLHGFMVFLQFTHIKEKSYSCRPQPAESFSLWFRHYCSLIRIMYDIKFTMAKPLSSKCRRLFQKCSWAIWIYTIIQIFMNTWKVLPTLHMTSIQNFFYFTYLPSIYTIFKCKFLQSIFFPHCCIVSFFSANIINFIFNGIWRLIVARGC